MTFDTTNKMAGLKRHQQQGRALLLVAATCVLLLLLPKDDANEEDGGAGLGVLRVQASSADRRAAAESKNLCKKIKKDLIIWHNYKFFYKF
jgi:hypothetical protein